jgi:hypothetical protein
MDKFTELSGRKGSSFVKYYTQGGPFSSNVLATPNKPSMTFYTDRFQKTVVNMIISADDVTYTAIV